MEWRDKLSRLLPKPDFEDMYGFKYLHMAALGLKGCPLEGTKQQKIDVPDSSGKTALSWAVQAANTLVTKELLSLGADCNRTDSQGIFPLYYAAYSTPCLSLLLEAGANVHAKTTSSGSTALHGVARLVNRPPSEGLTAVRNLINAGTNINAEDWASLP